MPKFSCVEQKKDGILRVALQGAMDEDARDLPPLDGPGFDHIIVDLNELRTMNSVGIRVWKEWLGRTPPNRSLTFKNARRSVVVQMNSVMDFIPAHAKVESIYVPFYCETHDATEDVLYETGRLEKTAPKIDKMSCGPDGCKPEPDVMWERYISFLKLK